MMDLYKQQGLLFVYLFGIMDKDSNFIKVEQVNSMKFAYQEFEEKIVDIRNEYKEILDDKDTMEVFCIIGNDEYVNEVDISIKKTISIFFENINFGDFSEYDKLANRDFLYDEDTMNTFLFWYLKHLIYDNGIRFPLSFYEDNELGKTLCFYSNRDVNEDRSYLAKSIYDIWYENENPELLGKQVITKSFMLDDLKGRKIISHFTESETGETFLLLEGGLKLYLRTENPYIREKIGHSNLNMLTIGELDTIISNPIYAFNKWYQPYELYEDWQKVLNYALATSTIDWKIDTIKKIHKEFMRFMEKEICEIEIVQGNETIISEEMYYSCYLNEINKIREYFSGKEEAVISKDYVYLLSTRYVFLPIVLKIITKFIPRDIFIKKAKQFDAENYIKLLKEIDLKDINERGKALENIAEYLLECLNGIQMMGKRLHTKREEIDLSCCNVSSKSDIWKLGALILVECKNWEKKVGVEVVREMAYIMSYKGNSTSILFASNGITKNAKKEILNHAISGKNILCINKDDLESLHNGNDFENMLCHKYKTLRSNIEDSFDLLGV